MLKLSLHISFSYGYNFHFRTILFPSCLKRRLPAFNWLKIGEPTCYSCYRSLKRFDGIVCLTYFFLLSKDNMEFPLNLYRLQLWSKTTIGPVIKTVALLYWHMCKLTNKDFSSSLKQVNIYELVLHRHLSHHWGTERQLQPKVVEPFLHSIYINLCQFKRRDVSVVQIKNKILIQIKLQ